MKTFYSKHFLLTLFAIVALFFISKAQNTEGPPFCAGEAMMQQFLKNAEHQNQHQRVEQEILRYMSSPAALRSRYTSAVITLPVVVHIIHNGGTENISDAQVLKGIQDLNDAYANKGYYDPTTGVNTDIQFCLAQRDPNNLATNGITRDVSPLTNMTMETDDIILKNINRWQPTCYINIWLIKEINSSSSGSGVAGYAYLPSAHGSIFDGIVEEARWFGSSPANSGVTIHEMGHYLGLYHTFNGDCTNNNCLTDGDHVCDTPPDQSRGAGCSPSANSCTTDTDDPSLNNPFRAIGLGGKGDVADMSDNYMDYSPFSCYSSFSQGQKDRMNFFIQNTRKSLLACKSCETPCPNPVTASFTPRGQTIGVGTSLTFTNTSTNASSYKWKVGTANYSTTNVTHPFNTIGTFKVVLEASNADARCQSAGDSVVIQVVCPLKASITPAVSDVKPNTIVNFVATVQGATTTQWKVNGVVAGSGTTLNYNFPTIGNYNIEFIASNGLCSLSQNAIVVVSTQSPCVSSYFAKSYTSGQNEVAFSVIQGTSDGGIIATGGTSTEVIISKIDTKGQVVWAKRFPKQDNSDVFRDVKITADGGYIVTGNVNSLLVVYKFKADGSVEWVRNLDISNSAGHGVVLTNDGGYAISGKTQGYVYACVTKLSASGATQWSKLLKKSQSEYSYSLTKASDGHLVVVCNSQGTYTPILKFDVGTGAAIWTKEYQSGVTDFNENHSLDFTSTTKDGNLLVTGGWDANNAIFKKIDNNGNIIWAKKIGGSGLVVRGLNAVEQADGTYLVFLINYTDQSNILLKIDANFKIIWQKIIGKGVAITAKQFVTQTNGDYFVSGFNNNKSLVIKTNALLDGCVPFEKVNLTLTDQRIIVQNTNFTFEDTNPLNLVNDAGESAELLAVENCSKPCDSTATGTGTDCGATFLKILRGAGTNIIDVTFQPRIFPLKNEAGAYICGTIGDSAVLVKMRSDGTTEWERSFNFTAYPDIITELITDSDGNIVGSGYGLIGTSAPFYKAFIFKYNPTNNSFIWLKTPEQDGFNFHSIHEIAGNQHYIFTSSTYLYGIERLHMMRVDRNTGNIVTINQSYRQGNFISVYYKDALYSSSRYYYPSYRSSISKHDVNGNHLWTKACVVPSSSNARTYSNKLIIDNDSIVVAHSGNFTGFAGVDDGSTDYIVTKSDINGKTAWTKKYTLVGSGLDRPFISTILNASDGYYFIANLYDPALGSWGKFFVIKTDKNGVVKWSKVYGVAGKNAAFSAFERNGYIYFAGTTQSYGSQEDLFILKVDVNGKVDSDCAFMQDVAVNVETLPNYDEDQTQPTQREQFLLNNLTSVGKATFLDKDTKCNKECTVTTPSDCNNPLFSKSHNINEGAIFLHGIRKNQDNTFITFGTVYPKSTNNQGVPFLSKMTESGDVTWTKHFQLNQLQRIYNVKVTKDGGFIAVGSKEGSPIVMKLNSNGIIEWAKNIENITQGSLKDVIETPNGDIIVSGLIESIQNTIVAKFSANGTSVWVREINTTGDFNWVPALVLTTDGNLLVSGKVLTSINTCLMKLNVSNGNLIWQKQYSYGTSNPNSNNYIFNISKTLDNNYLALGYWNSDKLILKKVDDNGNVLWTKQLSETMKGYIAVQAFQTSDEGYMIQAHGDGTTSIFIKLDRNFKIEWQKKLGISDVLLQSHAVFEHPNGSFYLGYTQSTQQPEIVITKVNNLGKSCQDLPNSNMIIEDIRTQISDVTFTNNAGKSVSNVAFETIPIGLNLKVNCKECKEICGNGIDDDGDGLIDNADVVDCPCNKCFDNDSVKIIGVDTLCANSNYTFRLKGYKCTKFKTNWLINGNGVDIVSINDTALSVRFNQGTTLSLSATIQDSCGIDTVFSKTHIISAPPILELGSDKTICQTGVFTFKAPRGFKSYLWQDFTTDSVFTAFGAGKYWVRVMDSCGGVQSDTVRITQLTVPNLNIIPDTLKVCEGDSVMVAAPTGWATYRWSPSVGVNDTFKRVVTLTPSVSRRYFCAVSTTAGCVSSDSLWVDVKPLLKVSKATSICNGAVYKIGDSTLTKSGTYTVRLKSTTGGCDTLANVILNVINNVTKQIDSIICTNQKIKIGDSTFTKAGNYAVILRGRVGSCDTIVTVNLKVPLIVEQTLNRTICQGQTYKVGDSTFVKSGTYKVFINNTLCKDTVLTVNLKVTDIAVQTTALNTCPNAQNGRITASILNGTPPYAYAWSNGVTTANLSNLSAGIYTITVSDVNNCKDTATVNIKATPQYSYNLSVKQPTCFGDANGEIRITSIEKLSVSFDSVVFNRSGFLNNLRAGNYPIFVKDSNNCIYSEFINIPQPPQLTLNLPADTLLKLGDSIRIESITNGVGRLKYRWQPVRDLNCDTCASVVAKPTTGIYYTLTLTDSTGCQVRDDIRLQVDRVCNIFIPNVFSPFSTIGDNDVFYPYASDCAKQVAFMEIFDRWGEMVFHKINFPLNDPSNAWDGTLNGKQLEAAVYTYRIEIILADGRLERFFGDVTLMR